MKRTISALAYLALATGLATPALADDCLGAWSFGGVEDTPATLAALVKDWGKCAPNQSCTITAANGMTYVLQTRGEDNSWAIAMEQRAVAPGEALPFGITPADSPQQALKKIQKAGHRAGYGRTMDAYPATTGLFCPLPGGDAYLFEFNYGADHRMTGIRLTPAHRGGGIYVDDVTKSIMTQEE